MSKLPEIIKINSNIIDKFNNKIRKIIHKTFLEFKKKEGNENEFYKKCLTPDSNFNYYLQWEILSQISIKELLIKSKLDEYIRKNISKDYLIYSMIFFRYHINSLNKKNYNYKKIMHFDNYGLDTSTFWIPLQKINKNTGGLIFLTNKKLNNKFSKISKNKNKKIYQVLCNKGECVTFDKSLLHGANMPKKGFERFSIDLRVVDRKKVNLKKFAKNYYNSKGVFRPNKFLSIHKIDKELKRFKFENPRSLIS